MHMMRIHLTSIFKRCSISYSALMDSIKRTKAVCRTYSVRSMKTSQNIHCFTGATTTVSFCMLGLTKAMCNKKDDIVAPDPSTLTTETLLKNSTFAVVESTTSFLSQVTVSLEESCEQYIKALYILVKLMGYRLKVLDNVENEGKISDLIIEARASVNKLKLRNQELQAMYMSAYNLVNEASTAAFTAGSEFHSTVATSLLQSSEIHLSRCRMNLGEAEGQLREMVAKAIQRETEHTEKHRQKQSENNEQNEDLSKLQEQEPTTDTSDSDLKQNDSDGDKIYSNH